MIRSSINIERETREKLKSLGSKGETYDEIVNRLMDFYLENKENS